ncbi:MAG: zinc ribbon domain-containing protein [Phycisphaerae bacterium]|nr:zinc ribbon domain-containing protein [Phycisphaerae bacterium]
MPTYEYQCQACGKRFERFQPITAAPIRRCPACGRNKVRRLIGPGAGVLFKGSGFYQTDYRSDAYRKAAEKDKPADAAASSSTAASSPTGSSDASSESPKGKDGSSTPRKGKKK